MTIPSGRGRNGDLSITIILLKSKSTFHLFRSISPSINQGSKQTVFPKFWDEPLLDYQKQRKAKEQLKLIQQSRQGGSANRIGNTIHGSHNESRTTQYVRFSVPKNEPPTATRPTQSKPYSAKPNFSRTIGNISPQSSARKVLTPNKTSHFEDTATVNTDDFSQTLPMKGTSRLSSLITTSSPSYFKNLADFIPRLIRKNNRLLLAICLIDVVMIPMVLGFMLQSYFVLVFILGLILSFLAFTIAPVAKDRKIAIIPTIFFSLSWIILGLQMVWFFNQIFISVLTLPSKPPPQLDYKFAIVFAALSCLCSFSLHLLIIFNTGYIEEIAVNKPNRKRSKR